MLKKLETSINNPNVKEEIMKLPQKRAVISIVAQAIADNFSVEGPGWRPLKAKTIRQSVSKKLRKRISDMTDKELLKHESRTRRIGSTMGMHRQILRKTGLLMKSVTTPGAQHNIIRTKGYQLVYGTDLIYAGIHNKGGVINHPGTKNGFGAGITIPPHNITIPKREFLRIRDEWKTRLYEYVAKQVVGILKRTFKAGG